MSSHERAIFGDHLFTATDLQRRCGMVLNAAKDGPVTIMRNGEGFALMTRDKAKSLMDDTELLAARATIADLQAQVAALKAKGTTPKDLFILGITNNGTRLYLKDRPNIPTWVSDPRQALVYERNAAQYMVDKNQHLGLVMYPAPEDRISPEGRG